MLSSKRPIAELLYPHLLDQRATLSNQFAGMSNEPFNYQDFETARDHLLERIHQSLTPSDRTFLLTVQSLQPDWSVYDFERFPSVQWKLQNLQKLKALNPNKYEKQLDSLKRKSSL